MYVFRVSRVLLVCTYVHSFIYYLFFILNPVVHTKVIFYVDAGCGCGCHCFCWCLMCGILVIYLEKYEMKGKHYRFTADHFLFFHFLLSILIHLIPGESYVSSCRNPSGVKISKDLIKIELGMVLLLVLLCGVAVYFVERQK